MKKALNFAWPLAVTAVLVGVGYLLTATSQQDAEQQQAQVLTSLGSGLAGYWSFDEVGSAGTQFIGGASLIAGKSGSAVAFDGNDDYVKLGDSLTQLDAPSTISAWVKLSSTGENPVFEDNGSDIRKCGVAVVINSDNQVVLETGDCRGTNHSHRTVSNASLKIGEWVHIAGVFNGWADKDIYINGTKVSATMNGRNEDTIQYGGGTAAATNVGRRQKQGTFFSGSIDELRLYERALSAEEVVALYGGTPLPDPAPSQELDPVTDESGAPSDDPTPEEPSGEQQEPTEEPVSDPAPVEENDEVADPAPSTKFAMGDTVKTTSVLNVRGSSSLGGAQLGSQPVNALGTVVGGPITADGFVWWNIDYTNAPDGWSVEDFLVKSTVSTAPPPATGSGNVPAAIAAMTPGTWLQYGRPWDDAEPNPVPCNDRFGKILTAWNGWARDDLNHVYVAASGGHDDGCDNGVYRYDIQAGKAELIVPHQDFNAGDGTGQPFVADSDGDQIVPRSSHTYQGVEFVDPWVYLVTGSVYQNGKRDGQVWRFHTDELRWERLPDRRNSSGNTVGLVAGKLLNIGEGFLFMGGWSLCDADLVAGTYACQNDFYFNNAATVAWDPVREGIWRIDVGNNTVAFLKRINGKWQKDDTLSGSIPESVTTNMRGYPGICVVPNREIIVWSGTEVLSSWDGSSWSQTTVSGGPSSGSGTLTSGKWSWDDASGTCIGGTNTNEGLWVYKPTGTTESSSEPEPTPSTKFAAGDRVMTTNDLNVRSVPDTSGSLLTTQPASAVGTITSGPIAADGFVWWNVDYDAGLDGWSVENFLTETTGTVPVEEAPEEPITKPAPTLSLSANPTTILAGQSSILSWSSQNADHCVTGDGWGSHSESRPLSGTESVSPIETTVYTLTCFYETTEAQDAFEGESDPTGVMKSVSVNVIGTADSFDPRDSHISTYHDKIPNFAHSPTIRTVRGGAWSNSSTWNLARTPQPGDIVAVSHEVSYDSVSGDVDVLGIEPGGIVRFETDENTRLKVATILVMPDGAFEVGTPSRPVEDDVTAEVIIKSRAPDTLDDGVGVYDPSQYGTGILAVDGIVTMYGAVKSPTFLRLSNEPRKGDTTLTLETAPSGWKVGDKLVIPDTREVQHNSNQPQWEELYVQSISGRSITLTQPLAYDHLGARDAAGNLEFLPHIGNLSRNIIIRSENPNATRGHILLTRRSVIDIENVLLKELGRTKVTPLDSTAIDAFGTATHIGTNQIGRYSLHLHHIYGPEAPPASGYQYKVKGNALDATEKWGIAVHDTHYGLIQDNVVYNAIGAGIVTEDGTESGNLFDHNFVVRSEGSGDSPTNTGRSTSELVDNGHEGSNFWFRASRNYITNNVAANARFAGYMIFSRFGHVGKLGNRNIPLYQGANPTLEGEFQLFDVRRGIPFAFDNNEAYGTFNGFEYWYAWAAILKNAVAWHIENAAYWFSYHGFALLDDVTAIGDNGVVSAFLSKHGTNFRLSNLNIQNVARTILGNSNDDSIVIDGEKALCADGTSHVDGEFCPTTSTFSRLEIKLNDYQVVSGTVGITIDTTGVPDGDMFIYVDGRRIKTDRVSPYDATWNTEGWANGTHQVHVRMSGSGDMVPVIVNNPY